MRPSPHRAESGVYSKIGTHHRHHKGTRPQSCQDTKSDEEGCEELHPARNVCQPPQPIRIRSRRKALQQERLLCAMERHQEGETQSEEQIELIGVRLQVSPEESRFLDTAFCHRLTFPFFCFACWSLQESPTSQARWRHHNRLILTGQCPGRPSVNWLQARALFRPTVFSMAPGAYRPGLRATDPK